jgi:hypothetical protein
MIPVEAYELLDINSLVYLIKAYDKINIKILNLSFAGLVEFEKTR